MEGDFVVDYLTREALQQCARHNIHINRPLMRFMNEWLLVSRGRDLIQADEDTTAYVYQSIYDQIIDDGPVIRMLKLAYYFKNITTDYEEVQEKYEKLTKEKLTSLLENICTFSGTTKKELDEIFKKITIYIIASNKMFSARNSHMVAEAKCALRSVLTKEDLLDFVNRKKHYRMEYLERLGKILCGILLFNKHIGLGGEAIRDVVNDITVAYRNTLDAVRYNLTRCNELISLGLKAVSRTVTVNLVESKLIYRLPEGMFADDLELFNKFNYLHLQHEIFLHQLKEPLNRLKSLYEANIAELKEIFFQLDDVIKFRLAVPSDTVYPRFTKLFETWYRILMQLYYLVEINKINDEMVAIVTTDYPFEDMAIRIAGSDLVQNLELTVQHVIITGDEPVTAMIKRKSGSLFSNPLQRFCALTMALTQGILVQAEPTYGVLPFQDQFIAFKRKEYGVFAEKNYRHVVKYFLRTALQNPEMCILFNIPIESSPLSRSFKSTKKKVSIQTIKSREAALQTEHCLPPCTLESRNTYSWNVWDYRRRAIQLANLRNCQTNSTQTNITYSSRDAEIQTYDRTSSTHRCICSSSQLSRSVCQILDETKTANPSGCLIVKCLPEK